MWCADDALFNAVYLGNSLSQNIALTAIALKQEA